MITPWSIAHERMQTALKPRTIEARPQPPQRQTGRPIGNKPQNRRQRIRDMLAAKVSSRVMADRIGISRTAVQRHLRAIRGERT